MTIDCDNSNFEQMPQVDKESPGALVLRLAEGANPEAVLASQSIFPHCFNESDRLRTVIIGYADNLYDNGPTDATNNETAAKNFSIGKKPTKEESMPEFRNLQAVLEANGVDVLTPDPLGPETGVINQSYSRDIGFVVGTKFFVSRMKTPNRMREWESIAKYIAKMPQDSVSYVPDGMVLEGGDIVVDKGSVFVGISQRTSEGAITFLEEQLAGSSLKVVPLYLRSIEEGREVLHLDCAFVPVGQNSAIIYEDGMLEIPPEISRNYDLIRVTLEEQQALATNVLALSPSQVIARDSAYRVNGKMAQRGIEVIPVQFNDAAMFGGSIRCCTLPLLRQN